jgi:hypothetical protein
MCLIYVILTMAAVMIYSMIHTIRIQIEQLGLAVARQCLTQRAVEVLGCLITLWGTTSVVLTFLQNKLDMYVTKQYNRQLNQDVII